MSTDEQLPAARGGNGARPRRELVAQQIIDVAAGLFAERGFAGTSLQDVAEAAGLTRPALYHYFSSKDELLERVVRDTAEVPAQELAQINQDPGMSPVDRLRATTRLSVDQRLRDPARFRMILLSEADLSPEIAAVHNAAKRTILEETRRIIDDGIRDGAFRPVDSRTAALAIIGMCNWTAWWHHPGDPGTDEIAAQIVDMAVASVLAPDRRDDDGAGMAGTIDRIRRDLGHLERLIGH